MVSVQSPRALRTIPFLIAICFLALPVQAKYSGGTGEPNDPYQIATAADLIALGETPEDYDKHFILTADIDLRPKVPGPRTFDKAVIAPDRATPFTGVFDGDNHTVLHLFVSCFADRGLFGSVGSGGEIRDVGVVDLKVTGLDQAGGLVARNAGTVSRCYSTGSVSGYGWLGGLIGRNEGSVIQCYSTCTVTGRSWSIGGLVGDNDGTVIQCYSTGAVTLAPSNYDAGLVGGLVGGNDGNVTQCYSTGAVNGLGWAVGGLVGGGARVIDSFWDVQTSGRIRSAGGTGKSTAQMQRAPTFLCWIACGNEGGVWTINDGNDYPRLCWEDKPGAVMEAVQLSDFLRGKGTADDPYLLYSVDDANVTTQFHCEQAKHFRLAFLSGEGTPENPYLIKTADQINLLSVCPYERNAHFRLAFLAGEGTSEDPYLIETADEIDLLNACPYEHNAHFKLAFLGGEGTPESPYLVSTAGQFDLVRIAKDELDKNYKFTADIDMSGRIWSEALIPSFSGVFDGNNHTISHLTIKGESGLGLFGQLDHGAEVRNIGLVDVNITSSAGSAGGLVHENYGSITNSYSTGSVNGSWDVGGLVGANRGTVTACYSTGAVDGGDHVGGLVGSNAGGHIAFCYSTCIVAGNMRVGGLVGDNSYGYVVQSYSAGPVSGPADAEVGGLLGGSEWECVKSWNGGKCYSTSVVTQSFWGLEASSQATSAGGEGRTTAEMQTASTFLEAGWDFVGETANGPNDVWKIAEGLDYPRLWWEPYDGRVTVVLGQVFTVTLESNPSTGYRWEWVDHQDSIVEQMGQAQFKPCETGDPPLVGAGGWESFDFKAVKQGQMTLKLAYRRPWEEGVEPLKTCSLQVAVP